MLCALCLVQANFTLTGPEPPAAAVTIFDSTALCLPHFADLCSTLGVDDDHRPWADTPDLAEYDSDAVYDDANGTNTRSGR